MSFILQLETSSKCCSVAISSEGRTIVSERILSSEYIHAEALHPMIAQVLDVGKIKISELCAVAVSKGPGSYTGLRIGVSAAKGICFAQNIPLISIETTELLAAHAISLAVGFDCYVPMIDARRMEVYMASFNSAGNRLQEDKAQIVDELFHLQFTSQKVCFAGDGASKASSLAKKEDRIEAFFPEASMMSGISFGKYEGKIFEESSSFEPYYLKDYIPGVSKKTLH